MPLLACYTGTGSGRIPLLFRLLALLVLLSVARAEAVQFRIATASPDGLGWMRQLRAAIEEVETQTDQRVTFKLYPGGVQGDDFTVLRKMRIGQLQGGAVVSGSLVRFFPDLQLYSLPMTFRSFAEVDYVRQRMDGMLEQGLDSNGIHTFALAETGFAYILSKTPVRRVADLASLKVWVPSDDRLAIQVMRSFGIDPIPLLAADVLPGLQSGLINAIAAPPIVALALQWHTQVQYVTDLPIVYIYSMLALDKKAFSRLSAEDQKLVDKVMNRTFQAIDRDSRLSNERAFQALLDQGLTLVSPSAAERQVWYEVADRAVESVRQSGGLSKQGLERFFLHLEASPWCQCDAMTRLRRLAGFANLLEDTLLLGTFVILLLLGALQIALRNLFGMGLVWSEPLVRALVLWLALQGAMVASRENRHLCIDLFGRYLHGRTAKWVQLLINLISACVCGLVAFASMELVTFEYEDSTTLTGGLPIWVVQLILPLSFTVMGLRFLRLAFSPSIEKKATGGQP